MSYFSTRVWTNRHGMFRIVWANHDVCVGVTDRPMWFVRYLKKIGEPVGILWFMLGRLHLGIRC